MLEGSNPFHEVWYARLMLRWIVLLLAAHVPQATAGENTIVNHIGPTTCPPGASLVGGRPPDGLREGCESPDGTKTGVWTEWYHSGSPRQRGHFEDGKEVGPWVQWHANGEVRIQGEFRSGVLHGEMRSYYTNGVLNERGSWKEGVAHGPAEAYFPSGKRAVWGQYAGGVMVGNWWTWEEGGLLVEWVAYPDTSGLGSAILREETPAGIRFLFGRVNDRLPEGDWWAISILSGGIVSTPPPIRRASAPSAPPILSRRPSQ